MCNGGGLVPLFLTALHFPYPFKGSQRASWSEMDLLTQDLDASIPVSVKEQVIQEGLFGATRY